MKRLLHICNKSSAPMREFKLIRGNVSEVKEELDAYSENDRVVQLMKKKKCELFIGENSGMIVLGRTFNNEILDMYKFKICESRGSSSFVGLPPEFASKYFVIVLNCEDKRLENLVVDILHQKSHDMNIECTRYAWIFCSFEGKYILKYVRVSDTCSVEDIGPFFVLEEIVKYNCGDEMWREATKCEKKRKIKNVEKNECKEIIGKMHIDRQDLRDIRLKKGRGRK